MILGITKLRDVKTPKMSTSGSAGIDFFIPNDAKSCAVHPGDRTLFSSGIKVNVPDGKVLIALNKSGIAYKKGLILGAQVIDSDYQGEVFFNLINVGLEMVYVEPGDKIVQLLLLDYNVPEIVEYLDEESLYCTESDRSSGGFGSTGNE